MSVALRSRWVEVESAFEALVDLDGETRLQRLTEIAVADIELANAVAELLAAGVAVEAEAAVDRRLAAANQDWGS